MLSEHIVGPDAAGPVRSAFIRTMCEEASCDLLTWPLEKGLRQGDAQSPGSCAWTCKVLAAAALRAPGRLSGL